MGAPPCRTSTFGDSCPQHLLKNSTHTLYDITCLFLSFWSPDLIFPTFFGGFFFSQVRRKVLEPGKAAAFRNWFDGRWGSVHHQRPWVIGGFIGGFIGDFIGDFMGFYGILWNFMEFEMWGSQSDRIDVLDIIHVWQCWWLTEAIELSWK